MIRRFIQLVTATTLLGLVAVLGVMPAQAATVPAWGQIGSHATVGRFATAVLNVWTGCRAKAIAAELTVQVTQGDVNGSRAGVFGILCDGQAHRVQLEAFSSTGARSTRRSRTSTHC
jgi:hypothetical protein